MLKFKEILDNIDRQHSQNIKQIKSGGYDEVWKKYTTLKFSYVDYESKLNNQNAQNSNTQSAITTLQPTQFQLSQKLSSVQTTANTYQVQLTKIQQETAKLTADIEKENSVKAEIISMLEGFNEYVPETSVEPMTLIQEENMIVALAGNFTEMN